MRRLLPRRTFVFVATLAVAVLTGCTKPDAAPPPATRPAIAGAGIVRGKVVFAGAPPVRRPVAVAGTCHPGSPEVLDETTIINPNGTLRNVVVYLKDAPPGDGGGPPLVLDQKDCRYVPHVFALQVGQPLVVRNSDPHAHNVHLKCEINDEKNFGMANEGEEPPITFKAPEFFEVGCDVHPWMNAQAAVFDHPCFAVTGDEGTFEIKNVPPGKYTLVARHERFGEQSMSITVADKRTEEAAFTYTKSQ